MIADILAETIKSYLGPVKTTNKGWLTRNCMLCHTRNETPDKRGRFGIRFEEDKSIIINCFNCGYDAKWVPGEEISNKFRTFLLEVGIPRKDVQKLVFEAYKEKAKIQSTSEVALQGSVFTKWNYMPLPKESMTVLEWLELGLDDKDFLKVAEYAVSRNFTRLDKVYWSPETKLQFNKRLILPFYYNNKIVGHTGRWYDNPPSKKVAKYINHMPDSYIYNLDKQKDHNRKYVILAEGVFDAWITDGISPINNTLSPTQIDIINSLGKEIVVCPDRDKAGKDFINVAVKEGWSVAFPKWEKGVKDPAEAAKRYGRILTVQSILETKEQNKMKIELKWRLGKGDRRIH